MYGTRVKDPCAIHPGSPTYASGGCKECVRQRARDNYALNREKRIAGVKAYKESRKDKMDAWKKKYREDNAESIKEKQAVWYAENAEAVKARTMAYYYENHGAMTAKGRARWHANREENAKKSAIYRADNRPALLKARKEYYRKAKIEAISHYSGGTMKCTSCSIDKLVVLCLDHLSGGGTKHRKEEPKVRGHSVHVWVRSNNYPPIFQVLCFNCNFKRSLKPSKKTGRYKAAVLKHYSGGTNACMRCSILDPDVLCIDHVNGGGIQEMRKLGMKGGTNWYKHLVQSRFPKGYQTLCFNCNTEKHVHDKIDISEIQHRCKESTGNEFEANVEVLDDSRYKMTEIEIQEITQIMKEHTS